MYFRIKHRFWSIQPVFHFHNIKYWLIPPGIITHKEFPTTKYYNPFDIECILFDDLTEYQKDNMIQMIQTHYLREKEIIYNPTQTNILTHFLSHNFPPMITFYNNSNVLYNNSKNKYQLRKEPIAVLTGRPLHVSLYNNEMITNYVDYLCVNMKHRKKNIAPQTIYTYALEHRKRDSKNITFLFKREGELTSIVPLVTYSMFCYNTEYWTSNVRFPQPYQLTKINKSNSKLLLQNMNTYIKLFSCFICSSISNIERLIEEKILIPFIIHNKDDVVAIYFFKETCVTYNNKDMIDLVGSIIVDSSFKEFFELGLGEAFKQLKRENKNIGYLNIECISHNHILLTHIQKQYTYTYKVPYSYYFYNFAIRPILHNDVFILS